MPISGIYLQESEVELLSKPFDGKEVRRAIFSLKPFKAGVPTDFMWGFINIVRQLLVSPLPTKSLKFSHLLLFLRNLINAYCL